jgi:PAS domain-containing protein
LRTGGQCFLTIERWLKRPPVRRETHEPEELLRSSERHFELILDSIPGFVLTTTPNGALEFVNRRVLEYFGRTLAELKQWATSDSTGARQCTSSSRQRTVRVVP